MLTVNEGEAGFAASGTNLCAWGTQNIAIGLGGGVESQAGDASRVWYSHDAGSDLVRSFIADETRSFFGCVLDRGCDYEIT